MTLTRELVYGRRPVREVIRAGRRQLVEVVVTDRALASETWLQELERPRPRVEREAKLNEISHTRDHQGVVAWCEPYRYADAWELAASERPLIACLDQVTDPHNLGAVCRTAEAAGATGVVVPERNSARVTAAVCRASAGAVEHLPVAVVVNLSRYLDETKRGDLWALASDGNAPTPVWETDFAGGVVLVFGSEGRGIRPGVRRACDDAFSIPLSGHVESLNVSVAAGIALFEAARQRRA